MITVPRFEKKEIYKSGNITTDNRTGILIKDHQSDNIVCYVNLNSNLDENKELADILITAIENFIENGTIETPIGADEENEG